MYDNLILLEIDIWINEDGTVVLRHDESAAFDTDIDQLIVMIRQDDQQSPVKIGLKLDFKSLAAASKTLPKVAAAKQRGDLRHVLMVGNDESVPRKLMKYAKN